MFALAEAVSQEITPFKIEIYFKALEDLSIEDIERAVWSIIRTRTTVTFPKVAEIRQALHGNVSDRAEIAWNKLVGAIRSIGAYSSVIFDDPVIHAIVEREGGWGKLCDKTSEELKWFGKDFLRMYSVYEEQVTNGNMTVAGILPGMHEIHNAAKGLTDHIPSPEQIGTGKRSIAWGKLQALETNKEVLKIAKGGTN